APGPAPALRAASVPLGAHALGIALAAYKIWPIVRWQLDAPRTGVFRESYSVWNVLENTLVLIPAYFDPAPLRPHYQLPDWGYNDRLVLEYAPDLSGDVRLHLRMPEQAELDVPFRRDPESYDV